MKIGIFGNTNNYPYVLRTEVGRAGRAFAERYLSPTANAHVCLRRLGLGAVDAVAALR